MESTNPLPTVELSVTPSSLGKRSVLRIVVIIVFIVLFVDFERAEDVRNLNAGVIQANVAKRGNATTGASRLQEDEESLLLNIASPTRMSFNKSMTSVGRNSTTTAPSQLSEEEKSASIPPTRMHFNDSMISMGENATTVPSRLSSEKLSATSRTSIPFNDSIAVGSTNLTISDKHASSAPPLRMCTKSNFTTVDSTGKPATIPIVYQCAGEAYEEFADLLFNYANNHSLHEPLWGRRREPIPANKTVLFFGNSHTRQTTFEMVCQFSDDIVSHSKTGSARSFRWRFRNNSTIMLLYNSPAEHAKNWVEKLESLTHQPLHEVDAMVLGYFNGFGRDIMNTSYYREMMNASLHDKDLDFGRVASPDIISVAKAYKGPIVLASNYDRKQRTEGYKNAIADFADRGRTNIRFVDSRKYIPLLNNLECTNDDSSTSNTHDCKQRGGHRCVGPRGGHPTLVSYDIQEGLWDVLSQ